MIEDATLLDRMADKFTAGDDCWLWTAGLDNYGYGQTYAEGRVRKAYAVMYELLVGPVPGGLELDHLCRARACIRPSHLEPVTHAENLRRGLTPVADALAARTHCDRGHEFTPENTLARTGAGESGRRCHECKKVRDREGMRRLRARRRESVR